MFSNNASHAPVENISAAEVEGHWVGLVHVVYET